MALKIMRPQDYTSEPMDDGFYESTITEITEVKKFNQFRGEEQDVLQIKFTIADEPYVGRSVTQTFNPVLNEKSNLMGLCFALFGRPLTVDEMVGIETSEDVAKLILNKNVIVIIKNKPSKKDPTRSFYSVSDFMKSKKVGSVVAAKKMAEDLSDDELTKIAQELEI